MCNNRKKVEPYLGKDDYMLVANHRKQKMLEKEL